MNSILNTLSKYVNRYLSTRVVFCLDMIVSLGASLIALLIFNLLNPGELTSSQMILWAVGSLLASFLYIYYLRTYRIIIRHATLKEVTKQLLVAVFKVLTLGLIFGIIYGFDWVVYVLVSVDFLLAFAGFLLLRIAMLITYDIVVTRVNQRKSLKNVLVYGDGDKSIALIPRLQQSSHYNVVGFILDGEHNQSKVIAEKPVYHVDSEDKFKYVIGISDADCIIFATEDEVKAESDKIIKYALESEVKMLFAPPIDEMPDGKVVHTLRNIEIEDLLMRQEIKVSMDEIIENFRGKTVMVTGAAGSIGSELCRQLATFGIKKLILYDNSETPMHNIRLELEEKFPDLEFVPVIGDVRLTARLDYAFRKWRPQVVFHAAAYKHVPLMEENPCEAVLVNVAGSRNVADKCIEYGAEKMVMVSTDKAVNPTNIMGCTKRLAEIYVQSLGLALEQGKVQGNTKFVTTRFGNVLGSNGSVIPRFRDQIAKGGPVTVTHPEITRFFMTIPEACRLVMEAATMSDGNQIFVFDMGESVKIDDLARRMIKLAGFIPDKDIAVEYSGLRPGEKLYEEVLSNKENTIPTEHSRIMIAKVRKYDYEQARAMADELERLSRDVEIPDMVRLMKRTVPEFKSKNSRFECYDKEIEESNNN